MRSANLLRVDGPRLRRAASLALLFVAACACAPARASAQTAATAAPPSTRPSEATGATADEDFELNIDTRRISERDFQAQTAVEAGGAGGLLLKVGAALRASDIELMLTGVRGRVRFRGNLAPLLRLLDARRATESQTPPAP